MKSVLPPALESKRITIEKVHNRRVFYLMIAVFTTLIAAILVMPRDLPKPYRIGVGIGYLILVAAIEAYGIYRIFKGDQRLCKSLGFLCPYCLAPLYEPRASLPITGRCPKCKKSIAS
jgi:hypothetical protein